MTDTRPIYNPLTALASSVADEGFKAEASMFNSDIGICPKCKKPMTTAVVANKDTVFYCVADRVALPTPNEAPSQVSQGY